MRREPLYVEGELYLELEVVAEVYRVQSPWLRECYDHGLLGRGVERGRTVCIAAAQLDRVATVVRLRHLVGGDVHAIRLELENFLLP